jgi:hypothetical protein
VTAEQDAIQDSRADPTFPSEKSVNSSSKCTTEEKGVEIGKELLKN